MALTPRATKGSALTNAEIDAAFNGLQTQVDALASGTVAAPVDLTVATALTKTAHANRDLVGNSAVTRAHTIAATGFVAGDEIRGYNDNSGTMTFTGAGFTISGSALLPPDVAQHEPFVFKCRAQGVWKRLA